jgi:predicted ester cyclase
MAGHAAVLSPHLCACFHDKCVRVTGERGLPDIMSTEDNKTFVHRWIEEVFNQKKTAAIAEFVAPTFVDYGAPPGAPGGLEGLQQGIGMFLAAFPDFHYTVEDMIAAGDKVMSRLTMRGTHQGALMGLAPTGKQVTVNAIDLLRIAGGKLVEHWMSWDALGMLQQLGAAPAPGQSSEA